MCAGWGGAMDRPLWASSTLAEDACHKWNYLPEAAVTAVPVLGARARARSM